MITAMLGWGLLACSPSEESEVPTTLPPEDTDVDTTSDTGWFPTDTGSSGSYTDETPPHTLAMSHTGTWELLPLGGPFTSLVGELHITEVLDDDEVPSCVASFALTGQSTEDNCDGCDYPFTILFYLTDEGDEKNDKVGGLADCRSPDLPTDGAVRTLAYADAEGTIYFDYYDSGIWLPWYDASLLHDEVTFSWSGSAGIVGEEEE